jgi:hypothetical protein
VEDKGGVRPEEKDVDSLIACLCGPHPSYTASRDATSPSSCSTVETGWSRRRASIDSLDEADCLRQAEVPTRRLCPSGEPNEAMAPEALTAGWFPHFAEEQARFDVPTDTNIGVAPAERVTERVTTTDSQAASETESATSDGLPRLVTNAVRYPEADIERMGEICLDLSPHSRRIKRDWGGAGGPMAVWGRAYGGLGEGLWRSGGGPKQGPAGAGERARRVRARSKGGSRWTWALRASASTANAQ